MLYIACYEQQMTTMKRQLYNSQSNIFNLTREIVYHDTHRWPFVINSKVVIVVININQQEVDKDALELA